MADNDGIDELKAIFPELSTIVSDWKTAGAPGVDPSLVSEHAGVTDADIEAYMSMRPGFRAPLPTNAPATIPPQFQSGRTSPPPPPAHVEGEAPPQPEPTMAPVPAPTAADAVTPVTAPPLPPEGEQITVGDRAIPVEKLSGLAALDELLAKDETLRGLVAQYMTTGQVVAPPTTYPQQVAASEGQPSPVAAPQGGGVAVPSAAAPLTIPEDFADDPALSALWMNQQRIESGLQMLLQNQQAVNQQQASIQQANFEAITNAAVSSFRDSNQLDDNQIKRVVDVANGLGIVDSFLHGIDPITNVPVRPDPHYAVTRTLEVAYNMLPEFQDREFERRQRQHVEDQARKAKLSAVGGGGPQAPRSQPAPTTPDERNAALHNEVAAMLQGTWQSPNQ